MSSALDAASAADIPLVRLAGCVIGVLLVVAAIRAMSGGGRGGRGGGRGRR